MLSRCVVSRVKHNSYFVVGLVLGLWVSLSVVPLDDEPATCPSVAGGAAPLLADEFEPQRDEKPPGGAGAAGRSVQRPRYYSTELGMRGSLLSGILSSEEALKNQVVALNRTAARLQPALKIFITASAMSTVPGLANVVGFTDTREMLKPFHALKYLADNYLEEYDFFFLVSDTAFVNARRLTELVSQLSVSQDVYMGVIAEDDSHYCSLESGIILSNSVLRAIHGELDWCVRNSYSPHHHENIGRCVLHAAHLPCTSVLQAETYSAMQMTQDQAPTLEPALADAVTVFPLDKQQHFYQIHAYVSRVHLERDHESVVKLRAQLWHNSARHPTHFRNGTWPAGLRDDPGMARPRPGSRFDHLRWTAFNSTHAFFPDDHHNVARIGGAYEAALAAVLRETRAWSLRRWPDAIDAQLVEGAWMWEPAVALRYRLLIRLEAPDPTNGKTHTMRFIEVVRPLGAARLVPVRYVTESAKVTLLVPVVDSKRSMDDALKLLQHYDAVCLGQDKNTAMLMVLVHWGGSTPSQDTNNSDVGAEVRVAASALVTRFPGSQLDVVDVTHESDSPQSEHEQQSVATRAALTLALGRVARDALLLILPPHAEFNQDFLNRVRMNTISGEQWYLPVSFSRYSQYDHPKFLTPTGAKPQTNTGRFNADIKHALAFYRADYDSAIVETPSGAEMHPAHILARSPLRCVRAPEPGLVLAPRLPPCVSAPSSPASPNNECARELRSSGLQASLDLGAKHSLAQLLLETQAELDL